METRANFALIGALVLMAVVAFGGFTLWLGQSQFNRDFDMYEIVFEGPVSLETGAAVRFNGISVGEVTRVAIDRGNDRMVRTRIRVTSQTPVRTDSRAVIDFTGITGLTFIQIQAGSPNAPLLERRAGEPIPVIKSELNPLSELFAGGAKVLETANSSLENIGAILSDDNVSSFSNTLTNLDSITGILAQNGEMTRDVAATLASIRKASDDFAEASRAVSALGQNTEIQVQKLATDTALIMTSLQETIARVDTLLETTNSAVDQTTKVIDPAVAAMEDVRTLTQDLRFLIQRLDSVAREIEENPQGFIAGNPKPYEGKRRR